MAITMDAFERRLGRHARRERQPLHCLFELTPTCNLRCRFCYVALDPYEGPYLSTAQVCTILDTVERAGVLWLTLTGGEILSRRDLPEIYRHAKRKGFLVTLYTNATMVTERFASLLRELPPYSVEVSIYGADAEHYERVTGIRGSYARFERGVRLLQDAGVPLVIKHPVSSLTADHVPALVEWCRARGLTLQADPAIDARHDGDQTPTLYRITPRRAVELRAQVHEINSGERVQTPLAACEETDDERSGELYRCGAGRTGFFIDGLGYASHCVIDREPRFPVLEMPWEELWAAMGAWVTQPLPVDAPCSGCSLRGSCSNCPARARLATGSPYLKDPYQCDVTHSLFGLPLADHSSLPAPPRRPGACVA